MRNRIYAFYLRGFMKKKALVITGFSFAAITTFVLAKKVALKFASGNLGGTYYKVSRTLGSLPNLMLNVHPTAGSQENIQLVRDGKADMAFTQLDVLNILMNNDRSVRANVKVLLPVYPEEVHILASKDVKHLENITGKRVSIGEKRSGTESTARIILQTYGIAESQVVIDNSSIKDGLEKLKKGQIDVQFIVASAPVKALAELDESFADKFHLLRFRGISYGKLIRKTFGYRRGRIKKGTYKWVARRIRTISVESAIIGRSTIEDRYVEALISTVFDRRNFEELFLSHSKWKSLDMRRVRVMVRRSPRLFHAAALRAINNINN